MEKKKPYNLVEEQIKRGIKPFEDSDEYESRFVFELFNNFDEKVERGEIPMNLNGHNGHKEDLDPIKDKHSIQYTLRSMGHRCKDIGNGQYKFKGSCLHECYYCGEEIDVITDGKRIWAENTCEYADGVPPYEFELNVPSGKMVVGNDFRDYFIVHGDYNVNKLKGEINTAKKYAEVGLAHAFVGNSCPGMYKINNKEFIIGTDRYEDDDYDNPIPPIENAEEVGSICTDLWWYSIADYDEFIKRTGEEPNSDEFIVECEPGVYKFAHQHHIVRQDESLPQIFTKINWVRNPDPIRDFKKEYESLNITAGQAVARTMESWSRMYENNIKGMMHAVHQILNNCSDWHPNGWALSYPDISNDMPSIDIPVFEERFNCSDLSESSFVAHAAGIGRSLFSKNQKQDVPISESYTALAFNMLRAIMLYGIMEVSCYDKESNKKVEKITKTLAKKIMKGLAKKYPDRVPENCKKLIK